MKIVHVNMSRDPREGNKSSQRIFQTIRILKGKKKKRSAIIGSQTTKNQFLMILSLTIQFFTIYTLYKPNKSYILLFDLFFEISTEVLYIKMISFVDCNLFPFVPLFFTVFDKVTKSRRKAFALRCVQKKKNFCFVNS